MSVVRSLLNGALLKFEGVKTLLSAECLPLINTLVVLLAAIMIYVLYNQAKNKVDTNETSYMTKSASTETSGLLWLNKTLNWLPQTWNSHFPAVVDSWIQDLNISLAKQKIKSGILIFGLREGSSPPLVKSIRDLSCDEKSLGANVLLETNDFGFFVTIEEREGSEILASSNYSAVLSHFHCWFSASLRRRDNDLILHIKSIDEKPVCRFLLKPHTKQTLISTAPETVGEALKSAVLGTSFAVNVSTWAPLTSSSRHGAKYDDSTSEEEDEDESCYGDSEDEDNYADVKEPGSTPHLNQRRSLSDGEVISAAVLSRVTGETSSVSVPASRSSTPVPVENRLKDATCDLSRPMSDSLGSLSNITRSPSGRGPAKPIRVREKRLIVKVLCLTSSVIKVGSEVCRLQLNYPHQEKETTMAASHSNPVTFDLSSRSSQLSVAVQSVRPSGKHQDPVASRGSVPVDSIAMHRPTAVSVPLAVGEKADGSVLLEFTVIENAGVNSTPVKRNSIGSIEQASQSQQQQQQSPLRGNTATSGGDENPGQMETKVTMVTSRKLKSSPTRSTKDVPPPTESDSGERSLGVSFTKTSVAETALRDLSTRDRRSSVTKTKIIITSVEQQAAADSAAGDAESLSSDQLAEAEKRATQPLVRSGAEDDSEASNVTASHSTSQYSDSDVLLRDDSRVKALTRDDTKVRRSRSFVFGGRKKKEPRPSSLLGGASGDDGGLHPVQSESNLKKKKSSSMSKLFSRKKKSKKGDSPSKEGRSALETTLENGLGDEVEPELGSPAVKPLRTQSFRRLLTGKKKDHKVSGSA